MIKNCFCALLIAALCFSCYSRPRIIFDASRPGITQVTNDCYTLNFSAEDGGVVQDVYFENDLILEKIEDVYPTPSNNYRLSKARILDDGESLISATYHKQPKLTMNRSFVILDDDQGLKLSWTVKNTGKDVITGQRTIRFLIKGSEIESTLKNGLLKIDLVTASGQELSLFLENSAEQATGQVLIPYSQVNQEGMILELRDSSEFKRAPKQRAHWWFILRVEER